MSGFSGATVSAANNLISFINKCPSPCHVVQECRARLMKAGFKELYESENWSTLIGRNKNYFVTKNQTTIIAFSVGGKYMPSNGFTVLGAHTDSPCLKVKPVSKREKESFVQVGVECYGGGTWHTWFDRDLSLAGRVMLKEENKVIQKLIRIDRPVLRVPNIAIHLNRDMGTSFTWNKETDIVPVLATNVAEELNRQSIKESDGQQRKHHGVLLQLICDELKISADQILDFELCLADYVPACVGGAYNEFIFSPRLDNLHSTFTGLQALINSSENSESLANESNIRMLCCFDDEEVGSQSAQGAGSSFLEFTMRRILGSLQTGEFEAAIGKSMMLSVDMAHAVHPNYSSKHEDEHKPKLHKGPVIKFNANQRYATTTVSASIIRKLAEDAGVPLQDFVVRNDSLCGSTIGPIMSAKLGILTLDMGSPMLSMHSIREMCSITEVKQSIDLFQTYYEKFSSIRSQIEM